MRDCSAVCARNASSRVYTVAHVSRVGRLRNQACSQLRCVHTDNSSVITYRVLSDVYRNSLIFSFFLLTPTLLPVDYFQLRNECLSSFFHLSLEKNFETRYTYIYIHTRSILCDSQSVKVWFELINVSLMITILQYEIRISNDFNNYSLIIRNFCFFENRILRSGGIELFYGWIFII